MPCAIKSSFKTGLQISLSRDQSNRLPYLFETKTCFHPSNQRSLLSALNPLGACCTGGGAEPGGGAERAWAWLAGGGEGGAGPLPCRRQAARGTQANLQSIVIFLLSFPECIPAIVVHCICPMPFLLAHAVQYMFLFICPVYQ
jgi:hypothetical protein